MDPIRDKYILDVEIPRSHDLKYKKVLRPLLHTKLASFLICTFLLDPIRGVTREPNGSEPHVSVLFIRTLLVRIAEPNCPDRLEPVFTVGLSVPVWDRSSVDQLSSAQGLKLAREIDHQTLPIE